MNATRYVVAAAVAATVLVGSVNLAAGQNTGETTYRELPIELRIYNVKEFFRRVPTYNFAAVPGTVEPRVTPAHEGGGVSIFAESYANPDYAGEARGKADRLRELIVRFVRPKEEWESMGGRSAVDVLPGLGLMLVKTTADGHEQIEPLLERIVPTTPKSLAIDMRLVELDAGELGEDSLVGFAANTEQRRHTLREATGRVVTSTTLTGFDGQVLSSEQGIGTTYVRELTPVVAEAAVGSEPTLAVANTGLNMQVHTVLDDAGETATFDFRLALGRLLRMRESTVQNATGESTVSANFHLPEMASDLRAGTLTMPIGVPVVVAGGELPAALVGPTDDAQEDPTATVQLYYVATIRVTEGGKQ